MLAPLPIETSAIIQRVDKPASSFFSYLDKLEADKKAEQARQAAEALKAAQEAAEQARVAAVWAAHPPGNDYAPLNCTWGVANWTRVPAGLGNANTWFVRAKAWGFNVGSEPRIGAVGVSTRGYYGHVVYVEKVFGDGTILIKEQNYDYYGSIRTRQANSGDFEYVYFE